MNNKLIVLNDANSEGYRFFREIKTNFELLVSKNNYKSLLITSLNKNEGKTFIASNLAVMLSNSFGKILLMDFNFENPDIYNYFKVENKNGIIDYLAYSKDLNELIKTDKKIKNLDLITIGDINKKYDSLITYEKIKNILEQLYSKYKLIIIDSPSFGLVPEVKILSSFCDSTIIVVSKNKVKYTEYNNAINEIKLCGGNLIGSILNYT
jgi:capsular exopolysaccharide synthesis family protein